MAGLTAADGCLRPNVPTVPYRLTFGPKCPHGKIIAVVVVIRAAGMAEARAYAESLVLPDSDLVEVAPV